MQNNHENEEILLQQLENEEIKDAVVKKELSKEIIEKLHGKDVYKIKILHSSSTEYCTLPDHLQVKSTDYVIVPTRYGKDLGMVMGKVANIVEIGTDEVYEVEKLAGEQDLDLFRQYQVKDKEAYRLCQQNIEKHKLMMKLVSAHHLLAEPKILFFFTADSRGDFRELVKDLVSVFRTRIELRQIGVRDEARVIGGMGVCGRSYCCHNVTDKLNTVSIKMAKKQNLSLNSSKISGPCGRLLCCLAYEYPVYEEQKNTVPQEGNLVRYENEDYRVLEVNILSKKIKLSGPSGRFVDLEFSRFKHNKENRHWFIS